MEKKPRALTGCGSDNVVVPPQEKWIGDFCSFSCFVFGFLPSCVFFSIPLTRAGKKYTYSRLRTKGHNIYTTERWPVKIINNDDSQRAQYNNIFSLRFPPRVEDNTRSSAAICYYYFFFSLSFPVSRNRAECLHYFGNSHEGVKPNNGKRKKKKEVNQRRSKRSRVPGSLVYPARRGGYIISVFEDARTLVGHTIIT